MFVVLNHVNIRKKVKGHNHVREYIYLYIYIYIFFFNLGSEVETSAISGT